MSKSLPVAAVKAHFSECLREVESGEPVVITRYGRPVAALVKSDDLERFERLRAQGPAGGLASIAGGWQESEELVALLEGSRRTPPRNPAGLG